MVSNQRYQYSRLDSMINIAWDSLDTPSKRGPRSERSRFGVSSQSIENALATELGSNPAIALTASPLTRIRAARAARTWLPRCLPPLLEHR